MENLSEWQDPAKAESKAQEQARLRRERRNAKIQAAGTDRLNKITSLSGRATSEIIEATQPSKIALLPSNPSSNQAPRSPSSSQHAAIEDPAEVDLSSLSAADFQQQHFPAQFRNDMLRQILREGGTSTSSAGPATSIDEDPMLRMMQQLLGQDGNGTGPANFSTALDGSSNPHAQPDTNLWRVLHAISATLLAVYAATKLIFNDSTTSQRQSWQSNSTPQLFWLFTTLELVLQSCRYFVDRGKLPPSGFLAGIGQMLPQPYANYVRLISRYGIIYTTIVSDAMLIVFILGCGAWWKGTMPA